MIEIPAELLDQTIQCIVDAKHPAHPWSAVNDLLQQLHTLRQPAEPEPEPNHHEAPV